MVMNRRKKWSRILDGISTAENLMVMNLYLQTILHLNCISTAKKYDGNESLYENDTSIATVAVP